MNALSVERINATSPYKVWRSDENDFAFLTTKGVLYGVSFSEEMDFAGRQSYQFSLARLNDVKSSLDPNWKIRSALTLETTRK